MCAPGQLPAAPQPAAPQPAVPQPGAPASAGEAVGMVLAGLGWLAGAEVASLPVVVQAEVLRGLERAVSVHTAARARVLAGFTAQVGYEDDGQGSPRTWLRWQTRITGAAASAAVGWMRRLAAHPAVADALSTAQISESWARAVCEWTDRLPGDARGDADVILLAAAAGGADLAGLAALAEEIRRRVARPDPDDEDGFEDRRVWLSTTFDGAGSLRGDLTAGCAAALRAVLDALGKKADRGDLRSKAQRDHDALEDACRRLIASGCLPDRAGQPTTILLHTDLDDLLGHAGNATPPGDDGPARAGGPGGPADPGRHDDRGGHGDAGGHGAVSVDDAAGGDDAVSQPARDSRDPEPRPAWPGPAARPGDPCDARIIPIVTGRVDHDLLDHLASQLADRLASHPGRSPAGDHLGRSPAGDHRAGDHLGGDHPGGDHQAGGQSEGSPSRAELRELLLAHAVALLSGPGALASVLRTGTLPRPAASVSLPLDIGTATDTIPAHLRRAVIARDRHCRAPGCYRPPAACEVHHIIPRSRGGPTRLTSLILLCRFHHLIYVHEWGWTITLNPDGTTTATSPDHTRQYHSHAPPTAA